MNSPRDQLLSLLEPIDGLEVRPSPVAGGIALFHRGKEFAHFHSDSEIDLRLTRKVIQSLGLVHPPNSTFHPNRAASSPWIEIRFHTPAEVQLVVSCVRLVTDRR